MGHYSFNEDLRDARVKELELAHLLYSRGKVSKIKKNDDYRYDLELTLLDGDIRTIELKHDMTHERTGNIGVEFECRHKPSGISVTEADYWCFALYDGFWLIPTKALETLIASKRYFRIAVGGDEGSNTQMYLFRGDWLKQRMSKL